MKNVKTRMVIGVLILSSILIVPRSGQAFSEMMGIDINNIFYLPFTQYRLNGFPESWGSGVYLLFSSPAGITSDAPIVQPWNGLPEALYLDGGYNNIGSGWVADNCVRVDNRSSIDFDTGDFSICFWAKTTSPKINNTVLDKRDARGIGYHVTFYEGVPLLQMCDTDYGMFNYWPSPSLTTARVNDGEWHYVAFRVDRDDVDGGKIYVDGICVLTFDARRHSGSLSNSEPLYIGRHKDNHYFCYEGIIDELYIYTDDSA